MEIREVAPHIFQFRPVPCNECDYRFGCWTSKGNLCALRAFRVRRSKKYSSDVTGVAVVTKYRDIEFLLELTDAYRNGVSVGEYGLAKKVGYDLVRGCYAKNE